MLLFMDGQAHYDTARIAMKYSAVDVTSCTWSVTAEGRFGNCIKRASNNNAFGAGAVTIAPLTSRLGPWTPTASGVVGFAIKVDDLRGVTSDAGFASGTLVTIAEGTSYHVRLALNPDGTFSLVRNETGPGGSAKIIAQSSEGLQSAAWAFVECKWLIHKTAGSFIVRVNTVPVLNYTGNTWENKFGNLIGVWNGVSLAGVSSAPAPLLVLRFCDVYLADLNSAAAADVSDFLGDGTVLTIMPDGAGSAAGWTPSAGQNWDAVNDHSVPDDDTTYIATASPGVLDLYNFENIPAGSIVKGAHVNILARKETTGAATVAPLVQPPGFGAITGPAQGVANITYDRYITQPYDLNPGTGVKFTASDINNGQFGVVKTV